MENFKNILKILLIVGGIFAGFVFVITLVGFEIVWPFLKGFAALKWLFS